MSRWVDADALKQQVESPYTEYPIMIQIRKALKDFIDDAPSIDIVFCKECKYWHKNRKEGDGMNVFDVCYDFQADDFCSYGEREGE